MSSSCRSCPCATGEGILKIGLTYHARLSVTSASVLHTEDWRLDCPDANRAQVLAHRKTQEIRRTDMHQRRVSPGHFDRSKSIATFVVPVIFAFSTLRRRCRQRRFRAYSSRWLSRKVIGNDRIILNWVKWGNDEKQFTLEFLSSECFQKLLHPGASYSD